MNLKKDAVSTDEIGKNKRDDILYEAGKLFRRKGFNGTSMQDIASEVGILKGSIYYYFNSKDEIFREVLNKGISPVLKKAELIKSKNLPPDKKLRELIKDHIHYIMDNNYSLVLFFQEKENISANQTKQYVESRNKYEKIFKDVLNEGIKQGVFPPVNVSLTVFAILGMCNWIIQWYNPSGPSSHDEIIEHMVYLICDLMLNNNQSKN
ncbi:MAG: TetR/AcrR family transcriptional regulator [Firmicutes bacterium]|jgi:AcrR family transcriptional regulator|nr:TetR/AcrR family transcriptional regulator [Bacillota bacterium]